MIDSLLYRLLVGQSVYIQWFTFYSQENEWDGRVVTVTWQWTPYIQWQFSALHDFLCQLYSHSKSSVFIFMYSYIFIDRKVRVRSLG